MRLERVTVQGYGPLADFDAVLEPKRLNLIIGPNEAGKSTFATAIVSTLFGVPTLEAEERQPFVSARVMRRQAVLVARRRPKSTKD